MKRIGCGTVVQGTRSLAEILPWLLQITPRVVLNKDGGLLACYVLKGIWVESLDPLAVDRAVADLEQALRGLDSRCTLWCNVLRRSVTPYRSGDFSQPGSRAMDQLYGRSWQTCLCYDNRHYLSVLWSEGRQTQSWSLARLRAWFQDTRYDSRSPRWSSLEKRIAQFEELLNQFAERIPVLGARRLEGAELLSFLQEMATPSAPVQPLVTLPEGAYLDSALGEDFVKVEREHLQCSGPEATRYGAALTIKAWPAQTFPGMLDDILRIPVALTLSQVFRLLDTDQAQRYLKDVQRFHLNLQKSWFSYVREALSGEESVVRDTGRAVAAAEARQALTDMTAEQRLYGYVNVTVLVWVDRPEVLDDAVAQVARVVRIHGFLLLRERLHLNSAWSGSLPGQWGELVRWHFLSSANWADLCALRTTPSGHPENRYLAQQRGKPSPALALFQTRLGSPYFFNLHHHDLAHTFVVGPSRSGKSVWVNFIISQFQRYYPAHTVIFDKDRSCRIPALLQGGKCFQVGSGGMRLNPLYRVTHADERDWLTQWLEGLLSARGRPLLAMEHHRVRQALEDLAALSPEFHCLRSLAGLLPTVLVEELMPWLSGGVWGGYFDHQEDDLHWSSINCFEMGEILRQPVLARVFLSYVFHRIDQLLEQQIGIPMLIYIEEAWFMLDDPGFMQRIRDWLKTLPKKLAFVIMATQSLDDLSGSDIFSTIADNVPTRIFLPNPQAWVHRELYQSQFGLLEAQIELLVTARQKADYLLHTPTECLLLEARFSEALLPWLRSDSRAQRCFDEQVKVSGDELVGTDGYFLALAEEVSSTGGRG
ncbi:MAG: hypothetical protein M0Z78_09195 [Betaproteobacteria bacterium]|nr:hypothetical protein [Betaproteobacteria bacterium]